MHGHMNVKLNVRIVGVARCIETWFFQISELTNKRKTIMIWGFRREVDENSALLGCYHYLLRNNPEERSYQPETFRVFAIFFFLSFFLIYSLLCFLTTLCASGVRHWHWSFSLIGQEVTQIHIYDHPPIYFSYEYIGPKYSCVLWGRVNSVIFCCFISVHSCT